MIDDSQDATGLSNKKADETEFWETLNYSNKRKNS